MSGQIAPYGAAAMANLLTGAVVPVAAATGAAPTWKPGMLWYNTTTSAWNQWNGTAWTTSPTPGTTYLALLTADPVAAGAINLADLTELTTSGYSRQSVTWGAETTEAYPGVVSNTNLLTFGAMGANMTLAVQWAALVTSASGTSTGYFLFSWNGPPIQVTASESITIAIGALVLQDQ